MSGDLGIIFDKPKEGLVKDLDSSQDEDVADISGLEEEIQDLKADNDYVEFVEKVVKNVKVSETSQDEDFLEPVEIKSDHETEEDDEEEEEEDEFHDAEEVEVPEEMAKEAENRFPPFWRTRHQLSAQMDDYKSDEDVDFGTDSSTLSTSSDSEEDLADDADKQTELKQDVESLVEMVEELALPPAQTSKDEQETDKDVSLARAIVDFDDKTYESDKDIDYVPTKEEEEKAEKVLEQDDSASSSSDEDEEDDMEV